MAASVMGHYDGIKPYHSSAEYNFMRGIAFQKEINDLNFMVFYSSAKNDAIVDSLNPVGSIIQSGYHRTEAEIRKKNTLNETIIGGKLNYKINSIILGLNFYTNKFNIPVNLNGYYSFKGDESNIISFDYKAQLEKLCLFGEIARSSFNSIALFTGSIIEVTEKINFSLLYRNYPENFINLHASGFGLGETRNEEGVYFGLYFFPLRFLKINAYYDIYRQPYRTYFNPLPTAGKECLVNTEIEYFKGHRLILKYQNERNEGTGIFKDIFERDVDKTIKKEKQNLRLEMSSLVNKNIRLRGRVEITNINYYDEHRSEKGILIFSDILFKPFEGLSFSARMIFFESDSYYSRIYEYESEIDGIYNNISLSGKGERMYFIINYNPDEMINLSFKYSYTYYNGERSIGSGYDLIKGNVLNKISFQIKLQL
jgi:hypothetical protein